MIDQHRDGGTFIVITVGVCEVVITRVEKEVKEGNEKECCVPPSSPSRKREGLADVLVG